MGFLDKLFKPRGVSERGREAVIRELLDLQTNILGILSPGALVGIPSTNFLSSVAMGAIISTTPGRPPDHKTRDLGDLVDVLIRAIDDSVLDDTPEAQAEFQRTFHDRWNDYLLPIAYVHGDPDKYLTLDKLLVHRLADEMGFKPTILEASQIDLGLQQVIRASANRVWPALR